jgi:MoxR-like ATPase
MSAASPVTTFIGKGQTHNEPWTRSEDGAKEYSIAADRHPARYEADDDLIAAVNTALLLDKPLLVTGNPGTGKSDLAERVAWELRLGPVLRFEAQSLSEANDLFYRYDLIGRMAAMREREALPARLDKPLYGRDGAAERPPASVLAGDESIDWRADFIELGALGKAILRAGVSFQGADTRQQAEFSRLLHLAQARGATWAQQSGQRSVVLIDEIDKASRDFPNDLLNGIDRMEFRIREIDQLLVKAPPRELGLQPIVIITSNLERDLPGPFLRRCAFHHIKDPDREQLARIVRLRVFDDDDRLGERELPPFYRQLLDCYFQFREAHGAQQAHPPGLTELIDVSRVLRRKQVAPEARWADGLPQLLGSVGALAKQREDVLRLQQFLKDWKATA